MIWTPEQDRALLDVARWLRARDPARQVYRLDGYAGTGKTTLAKYLAAGIVGPVYFLAYTGKAASVLRSTGIESASTIHSLLYEPGVRNRARLTELTERFERARRMQLAEATALENEIRAERARLKNLKFRLREGGPARHARLLVVDEHSMVNEQLGRDLESLGVPLLLLGDPSQLPPVRGTGYFNRGGPDTMLTGITRQAAESPILRYAKMAREGKPIPFGDDGTTRKVRRADLDNGALWASEQLLCGKNATRCALNNAARKHGGYSSPLPGIGERMVCLKNDRETGLFNGALVTVASANDPTDINDGGGSIVLDLDNDGEIIEDVTVNAAPFLDRHSGVALESGWEREADTYPLDFGYALTVHKAQGSEWDSVTVVDDGFGAWSPELRDRWLYTAITRAVKSLVIAA